MRRRVSGCLISHLRRADLVGQGRWKREEAERPGLPRPVRAWRQGVDLLTPAIASVHRGPSR